MSITRNAEYLNRCKRAHDRLCEEAGNDGRFCLMLRFPGSPESVRLYMEADQLQGLREDIEGYQEELRCDLLFDLDVPD